MVCCFSKYSRLSLAFCISGRWWIYLVQTRFQVCLRCVPRHQPVWINVPVTAIYHNVLLLCLFSAIRCWVMAMAGLALIQRQVKCPAPWSLTERTERRTVWWFWLRMLAACPGAVPLPSRSLYSTSTTTARCSGRTITMFTSEILPLLVCDWTGLPVCVCVCVAVAVPLCVWLSTCLYVCLPVCLSACMSVCVSVCLCLFVHLYLFVYLCLFVHLYLFVYLCLYMYVFLC